MSKSYNYTAYVVTTRNDLENAIKNKKHVIICRGELYNDFKESGLIDKIKSYKKQKTATAALGIATAIVPVGGVIALAATLFSGFSAYSKGKKDDLKNFKNYTHIKLDLLEEEIIFFYKDYNIKKDTYHEKSSEQK